MADDLGVREEDARESAEHILSNPEGYPPWHWIPELARAYLAVVMERDELKKLLASYTNPFRWDEGDSNAR
jgi:hypothetical protein